jgi:hypothetical protein
VNVCRLHLGMSEILHCLIMLEHKQGHLVVTSARLQFCFGTTVPKFPVLLLGHSIHVLGIHLQVHYFVFVVDRVLGTTEVPNTISGTDHLTNYGNINLL